MASITTRAAKGTPLTHAEVDANFTNLNTDKLDVAGIASGTAASPTIKFTGDLTTGIYRVGAGQLGFTSAGTQRFVIDSSGQLEASSLGSAALPVWSFVSDPNTGIYSPGADQLGIAVGGVEYWRVANNGVAIYNQPAPAAVDVTATLTVANLTAKIITSTTAAAVTMTLPTGTLMDGGFSGLYSNMAFEWSVINTGATNAVTVQGGTGHTVVGSGTIAASNAGRFLSRRTGATTWITYRLAS